MPRPASANADAHWLIPCSDAPEHTIIASSSQNTFCLISPRMESGFSPWAMRRMGTRENSSALPSGSSAHRQASTGHRSTPAIRKNSVDSSTTAKCPQQ